jgi:non-specific serine/threonine protein kinase
MTAQARAWVWQFGEATLDGAALELRLAGAPVAIEPKALELLMELLRHPGEVVTKDELLDAVWPGRVVTEGVLVKAVAKVRAAIGDPDGQVVRTVHGYGYRLVAEVKLLAPPRAAPAPSQLELGAGDAVPGRSNWRLLRPLGDGGQGEVWLGEQGKTRERRVFKFARDGAGLAALKREITLSRLLRDSLGERPDLVPVLDWNLDEPPYFLESAWSPAGSLLDWDAALGGIATVPLAHRLGLAAQVADALAAAHGVGVLHKDIKPGNVLVDVDAGGIPHARLGDFGSGRLLDPGQLEALGITRMGYTRTVADATGPTSGTPLYTAPEVLAGQAPTTRSDVYALGVLAWQLAIGDLRRPLAPGWERAIDDDVLAEDIAACVDGDPVRRLADPAELARRLRALDQRRQARQAQAAALAEHQRLDQRLARSRTRRRQLAALALALGLGLVAALAMYLQLRASQQAVLSEARRADQQAERLAAVNDFLVRDLLGAADPYESGRGELSVADVLQRALAAVPERFPGQPRIEAGVRIALGEALFGLSDYERAEQQARQALALLSSATATAPDAGQALELDASVLLAEVLFERSRYDEARALLGDPDDVELDASAPRGAFRRAALSANLVMRAGDSLGAIELIERALPVFEQRFGADAEETRSMQRNRAEALHDAGRLEDALAAHLVLLDWAQSHFGEGHLRTVTFLRSVAATEYRLERFADALPRLERAVALLDAELGPDHHHSIEAAGDLALFVNATGDAARALTIAEDALARARRHLGPDNNTTLIQTNNLALAYGRAGRREEAIGLAREAFEGHSRLNGRDSLQSISAAHNLAGQLQDDGRWAEAEALQRENLPIAEQVLPVGHWQLGLMQASWGNSLLRTGRGDEGRAKIEAGLALMRTALPDDHAFVQRYQAILAALDAGTPLPH